ncbi:MAG: hypothetical protein GY952_11685, partial [Rhodobacteraceae bacterium]|nr:hypothetical protein [Paracoccaceae bacterium]
MTQGFIFGGDTGLSYEQLQRRKQIAEQMIARSTSRTPRNVGEGLTAIGQALGGRMRLNRLEKQEAAGRDEARGEFGDILKSLSGGGAQPSTGTPQDYASSRVSQAHGISYGGDKQKFIDTIMPHALQAGKATGIDPRIIVAQAAQETGWGESAPGNNYFGIKSHGQPGGQSLGTHEYVDGQRTNVQDSFRQYESPAHSVAEYANFMQENPRYKPMMEAQGMDEQLAALGSSGYATDPNYASSVGAIARAIPMGGNQTAPAAVPNVMQQNDAALGGALAPQGAQIAQSGGLDPRLIKAMGNPYLTQGQRSVLQSIVGQQLKGMLPPGPMKQLQMQKLQQDIEKGGRPKPTDDVREYEFARKQGYGGTFQEWMIEGKKAG